MAYDDGYYYGQCKIVAVVDNTADNGKTVLITTGDNKTYSGTIANKKCEFLLPPRTLYTVQKVSSGSAEFITKVEAGYGDCILVHLNTGYVAVKQGDIVGLDYIKAATADDLKNKVPEANAVKELNSNLTKLELLESHTNPNVSLKTVTIPNGAKSVLFSYVSSNGARYDLMHVPVSLKSDNVIYASFTNGGTSYVMTYYIKENTIEFGCQSVAVNAGLVAEVSFFN